MCGIAGYVGQGEQGSEQDLIKMLSTLSHRGPDGSGFKLDGPAALGHHRLSILDLSSAAAQPMLDRQGRYIMTYNGEVYNYRQIASDLGLTNLRSTGDTEVILEAFRILGPEAVNRFNGMFAIALWDRLEKQLFLFRDRIGIKPLYYSIVDGVLYFASEIKALLSVSAIKWDRSINPIALTSFLNLGFVASPHSIYDGINCVKPGTYIRVADGQLETTQYWSLQDVRIDSALDKRKAIRILEERLVDAVEARLISDVPIGTFLSGGIDSSLVTSIACEVSDGPVSTFSIGFGDSKYDESHHAADVARHLKTNHTSFCLSLEDARSRVEDILVTYDEPFADASAIPTMLVSELAKEHVSVVLTGDGGDETHYGYGSYVWAQRFAHPLLSTSSHLLSPLLASLPDRYRRVSRMFQLPAKEKRASHIFSQEQYAFSLSELKPLLKEGFFSSPNLDEFFEYLAPGRERQAMFDLHHYLPDDLLVKVDRASMRVGLEARVPLLDHEFVEQSLATPSSLRHDVSGSKPLLKQILFKRVPAHLFDRPKWGFGMPVREWLRSDWRYLIDTHLSEESIKGASIVSFQHVEQLKNRYFRGNDYLYGRLWLLIVLHKWYYEQFQAS